MASMHHHAFQHSEKTSKQSQTTLVTGKRPICQFQKSFFWIHLISSLIIRVKHDSLEIMFALTHSYPSFSFQADKVCGTPQKYQPFGALHWIPCNIRDNCWEASGKFPLFVAHDCIQHTIRSIDCVILDSSWVFQLLFFSHVQVSLWLLHILSIAFSLKIFKILSCPALGLMPAMFAIMVLVFKSYPLKMTVFLFLMIPNSAMPWILLILSQIVTQDNMFIGNLCGCIIGSICKHPIVLLNLNHIWSLIVCCRSTHVKKYICYAGVGGEIGWLIPSNAIQVHPSH